MNTIRLQLLLRSEIKNNVKIKYESVQTHDNHVTPMSHAESRPE